MVLGLKIPNVYGEETVNQLQSYEDARILDIGCGDVLDVSYLTGDDVDVVQLDKDKEDLGVLRKNLCEGAGYDADQVVGNGYFLPFKDNSFDVVYAGASTMTGTAGMINLEASDVFRVLDEGGDFIRSGAHNDEFTQEEYLQYSFAEPLTNRFEEVCLDGRCFVMEGYDDRMQEFEERYDVKLDRVAPVEDFPTESVSYAIIWPFKQIVDVDEYAENVREQWDRIDAIDEEQLIEPIPDEMETRTSVTVVSYPDRDVFFLDSEYVDPVSEKIAGYHRARGETDQCVEDFLEDAEDKQVWGKK